MSQQAPESLIRYQPSVQIYEDMKEYHFTQQSNNQEHPTKEQDIVNALFPPRDWTDHLNKLYIQYVSNQPASREDVIELKQTLEKMLEDRQAKSSGICGIRQQLFSQTFDQIIRQVAIDCPERGLLLMRVRDQHKMTLAAYQTIYQSSVTFGIRKQVQSEEGKGELEQQIRRLEDKKDELDSRKDRLLSDRDLRQRQMKDNTMIESERRQQEMRFLTLQAQNLSKFLDSVQYDLKTTN